VTNYGVFLPTFDASAPVSAEQIRRIARRAEELDLAHLWVGDHLVWNVGMLSSLSVLAHVAAVTTTIRLGTGVYLLPLRHPVLAAKDIAAVDVMSGGRLILGVGVGGENALEYAAAGVELNRRGARMEEALSQLRALLAQEEVELKGDFASIPAVTLAPPPLQQRIPVWMGGRAQAVVERAAAMAEGYFPVWVSARRYRQVVQDVAERRGGLDGFSFALNIFALVGDSKETARGVLAGHMQSAYGLAFETFEKYAAFGTAEDVAEVVAEYRDAGVTDFALNLAGPDPEGQLEALAGVAGTVKGR
jgi:probable F420-dependent oxidoreductase